MNHELGNNTCKIEADLENSAILLPNTLKRGFNLVIKDVSHSARYTVPVDELEFQYPVYGHTTYIYLL